MLAREWDNLRSACEWFNDIGDVDGALRMVLAASPYATQNLHFELAAWAERAISLDGAHLHDAWPAAAATVAGFRLGAGDLSGSCALAQQAVDVETQRGLARSFETSCAVLGCATASGERERALQVAIETEQIAAAGGDPLELELGWYFRVMSQLATGPAGLPGLERIVEDHVAATEARGNPLELGCAYSGELAYALATDRGRALELYERVRRWAALAGSRSLPANAALLMAMSANPDNPLETLAFARAAISQHYDAAYWLGIRSALQPVVRALVDLRHHRVAAVLLGGLAGVTSPAPPQHDSPPSSRPTSTRLSAPTTLASTNKAAVSTETASRSKRSRRSTRHSPRAAPHLKAPTTQQPPDEQSPFCPPDPRSFDESGATNRTIRINHRHPYSPSARNAGPVAHARSSYRAAGAGR